MKITALTAVDSSEDMFDEYIETQTETADEINVSFPIAGFNCVTILNTSGVEASLSLYGPNILFPGSCVDPDNDADSTTGIIPYYSADLSSVSGGDTGYALRVTEDGEASPFFYLSPAVESGETYKFRGYAKAGTEASFGVAVYSITGGTYTLFYSHWNVEAAADWSSSWETDLIIPSGCTQLQIRIHQVCSAGAGTYMDFDNISLKKQETQTVSLIRDSIKDWWDYWFAPIRTGGDVVFYFPMQYHGDATLSVSYAGGTAKCGMCVPGVSRVLATSQFGIKLGITDYSKYVTDGSGTYLNPGNWAKRAEVDLTVPVAKTDTAFREIVKNRATACVFDYNEYTMGNFPNDDNLVAYWPFSEGGGSTVSDASVNSNDGTVAGTAAWTAGAYGYGFSFSTVAASINCGSDSSLKITGDKTISLWWRSAGTFPAAGWMYFLWTEVYNSYGFILAIAPTTGKLYYRHSQASSSSGYFSDTTLTADTLHHICIRVQNNILTFYIDGNLDTGGGFITEQVISDTSTLKIGHSVGSNVPQGMLDEVRMYDRALSFKEITALYNNPGGYRYTSDSGLQSLVVYGYTEDYTTTFTGPVINKVNHEVQGLI